MTLKKTLTLAAVLLSSAAAAQADDKITLNVIGFSGLFADNYEKFIIEPFEAANPDIDVVYQPSKNSAETLALLTRQARNPTIDVAMIDVSVAIRADEAGLFEKLDPAIVTNLADMPDWARMNDDHILAMSQDNLAILYNTEHVKEPPTSWLDLQDPKWDGKIGAKLADTRGVILLPILAKIAGADYKENIDAGFDELKKIAPNVLTWDPAPNCYDAVQSGEVDISICWNGRAQFYHENNGGIVGVSNPVEGSIGQTNTVNLVKGIKNPEAAQKFINFAISAESQALFAEKAFYGPVNTAVTLSDDVAAKIYGSQAAQDAQMSLDWPWIATVYADWVQRINREVIAFN